MSAAARPRDRLRRVATEAGSALLALVLLIWSLLPIYNMFLIALDPEEGEVEFSGNIYPPEPSLQSFVEVVTQDARYLENYWQQFGNSLIIGVATTVLTLAIGSLASFAVTWFRPQAAQSATIRPTARASRWVRRCNILSGSLPATRKGAPP